MSYLNCPACSLALGTRGPLAAIEYCPRCLARERRWVGMFASASPAPKPGQSRLGSQRDPIQRHVRALLSERPGSS